MAGTRYLTWNEAAAILGVSPSTVHRMICCGDIGRAVPLKTAQLSLADVERVAARRAARRPNPYFVSVSEAPAMLGMVRQRVDQLAVAGRPPYVETGTTPPLRPYRRAQIEVIARAERARPEGGV